MRGCCPCLITDSAAAITIVLFPIQRTSAHSAAVCCSSTAFTLMSSTLVLCCWSGQWWLLQLSRCRLPHHSPSV